MWLCCCSLVLDPFVLFSLQSSISPSMLMTSGNSGSQCCQKHVEKGVIPSPFMRQVGMGEVCHWGAWHDNNSPLIKLWEALHDGWWRRVNWPTLGGAKYVYKEILKYIWLLINIYVADATPQVYKIHTPALCCEWACSIGPCSQCCPFSFVNLYLVLNKTFITCFHS